MLHNFSALTSGEHLAAQNAVITTEKGIINYKDINVDGRFESPVTPKSLDKMIQCLVVRLSHKKIDLF